MHHSAKWCKYTIWCSNSKVHHALGVIQLPSAAGVFRVQKSSHEPCWAQVGGPAVAKAPALCGLLRHG
jgi:hypothetical protein